MASASRASVASVARYWADASELADINTSPGQEHTVADLRFCLERCADLLESDAFKEGTTALAAWDRYEPDISREGIIRQAHAMAKALRAILEVS